MPKVSVVDISDAERFQEIYKDDQKDNSQNEESDSDDSDEDLGIVPRILFSTFETLSLLVPLVSVHIALDIIVHQQYAQEFNTLEIAARAATASIGILPLFSLN
jgi:hypothetical protein